MSTLITSEMLTHSNVYVPASRINVSGNPKTVWCFNSIVLATILTVTKTYAERCRDSK